MKKLFAILAISGALVACNNSDSDKAATTDSPKVETPAADANKMADTANKMMNNAMDTGKKMINNAMDTAKKAVEKATGK